MNPLCILCDQPTSVRVIGAMVVTGNPEHPDDLGREDVSALDPGESVILYRGFRDFSGPYVAHCHNLAHEDHGMMFGWEITP